MVIAPETSQPAPSQKTHVPRCSPKNNERLAGIGVTALHQLRGSDPHEVCAQLERLAPAISGSFVHVLIGAHEQIDWEKVSETRRTETLLRLDAQEIAPE